METLIKEELRELRQLINCLREELRQKAAKEDTYLDNQDLARILKISICTLTYWREQGIISYSRVGNKFYYKRSDVDLLMQTNYYQAKIAKDFERRHTTKTPPHGTEGR